MLRSTKYKLIKNAVNAVIKVKTRLRAVTLPCFAATDRRLGELVGEPDGEPTAGRFRKRSIKINQFKRFRKQSSKIVT